MAKFELDKNYNIPALIALSILAVSLVHSIVKMKKNEKKTQTPITSAIADIKNGNTKVKQVPSIN